MACGAQHRVCHQVPLAGQGLDIPVFIIAEITYREAAGIVICSGNSVQGVVPLVKAFF
jgi:hypothetical protein